jgi:RND family efflux transporter MFP subunit
MAPLDCVINPSVVADLGSGVPGILSDIRVDRSDFVKAGDVVAHLDSGVEAAALELARARAELTAEVDLRRVNAAFGQRQNKRTMDLFHRKAISTNDMDQRRTEARLAQIQLRQATDNKDLAQLEKIRAEEILKRRTIKSPIDGVVMERFKVVGEYVEEKPVVRVAKIDPLHVEVIVPVQQLGKIKNGMRAEVWSETLEGETWQATVSRVDSVADVASGTYGVRLVMPNPEHKIPAGLRCRMQLVEAPVGELDEQTAAVEKPAVEVPIADMAASEKPAVDSAQPVAKEPMMDITAQEKPVAELPVAGTAAQEKPLVETAKDVAMVKQVPKTASAKPVNEKPQPLVASADAEARRVRVALPDLNIGGSTTRTIKEKAPSDQIKPIRRPAVQKAAAKQSVAIPKVVAESEYEPPVSVKVAKATPETGKPADSEPQKALPVREPVVSTPVAVPEVAEAYTQADTEPAAVMPECRLVGPYADEAAATRQVVKLRKAGLYADIKSVNTYKRAGYKIVTPLQKSRADMKAIAAKLEAAGFTDYYVPRKKSSPMRVILGLYKGRRMAQKWVDKLAGMGFRAEIQPWKKKESKHYLVIRRVPNTFDNDLLADLPLPDSNGESAQSFCNHLTSR